MFNINFYFKLFNILLAQINYAINIEDESLCLAPDRCQSNVNVVRPTSEWCKWRKGPCNDASLYDKCYDEAIVEADKEFSECINECELFYGSNTLEFDYCEMTCISRYDNGIDHYISNCLGVVTCDEPPSESTFRAVSYYLNFTLRYPLPSSGCGPSGFTIYQSMLNQTSPRVSSVNQVLVASNGDFLPVPIICIGISDQLIDVVNSSCLYCIRVMGQVIYSNTDNLNAPNTTLLSELIDYEICNG